MSDQSSDAIHDAVERALCIEREIESAGEATLDEAQVAQARERMRDWLESVVGFVCSPGTGRVMLVHANGQHSTITSPELPFLLSRPGQWESERIH